MQNQIYTQQRIVTNIDDCYFYHTMEIPEYGVVEGEWDLRSYVQQYLGGVEFKSKRVLEMGTASGFLCFEMEKAGAEVVCYDLSEHQSWDIVPFAKFGEEKLQLHIAERKAHIRKLNNGFWFAHNAHNSKAKVVYGSIYAIPRDIGNVDITTFTSILLHVRDPFLALYNALSLTQETVIITEVVREKSLAFEIMRRLGLPYMSFLPNHQTCEPMETWWSLSPDILRKFIRTLGFEKTETKFFSMRTQWGKRLMFTIVGHR
ncbi:class I SAM-dependent methyltransferase [Sulfurirhabdus autotrophica]|uniref:Methyltransferase family protein n=1 Tax=Sulfurirhabdus autotrophica TaxID=1706046 RepID=A0A4R3YAT1_9PROT|nr:methyltransferase domain-containing protein [Sulfurirhabdus autotrophica]TCV88118.1 methyltransferase family protein [Sulfurirhabdus autotrophica]